MHAMNSPTSEDSPVRRRARWRWELALAGSILICVGVLVTSETGHMRLEAASTSAVAEMGISPDHPYTAQASDLLSYLTVSCIIYYSSN